MGNRFILADDLHMSIASDFIVITLVHSMMMLLTWHRHIAAAAAASSQLNICCFLHVRRITNSMKYTLLSTPLSVFTDFNPI